MRARMDSTSVRARPRGRPWAGSVGCRYITLKRGEAFFEVAEDPRRPFVVEAGEKRVIALGTKFSVRRAAGDIQVVVKEGQVRIEELRRSGAATPLAQLSAGAVARAGSIGTYVEEKPLPQAEEYLSWMPLHLCASGSTSPAMSRRSTWSGCGRSARTRPRRASAAARCEVCIRSKRSR